MNNSCQILKPIRYKDLNHDLYICSLGSSLRQAIEMANFSELPVENDRDLLTGQVGQGNLRDLSGPQHHQGQSEVDRAPSSSPAQRLKNATMCSEMCGCKNY